MRIAYAGTARISAEVLDRLRERFAVELVIAQPDRPAGRGRKLTPPAVARYAREHELPLLQPERMHDPEVLAALERHGIDTIVVVAFGQLVREPVLSNYTVLNVHASLLPAYRGAAPVERAIIDGCTSTGVSIMQLEAGLDTGPVAKMVEFPIGDTDTAGDIYERIAVDGTAALVEVLGAIEAGTATFVEQDHARATYAHKLGVDDRSIDPAWPARRIHDLVRGLSPHVGARLSLDGTPATIWRTAPPDAGNTSSDTATAPGTMRAESGRLFIACGDGWLEILELQPQGRKRMTAEAYLAGVRGEVGTAAALETA